MGFILLLDIIALGRQCLHQNGVWRIELVGENPHFKLYKIGNWT